MFHSFRHVFLILTLAALAGGQITGSVENGTEHKPVANAQVYLLLLQNGMQPLAETRSDAAGRFAFTQNPAAGAAMMLRADYKGVQYFQPLPPGKTTAQVVVYEPTEDDSKLRVTTEAVFVQPEQGQLAVVDVYVIENNLEPRRTLYRAGGVFRFRVPAGVQPDGARVVGPGGMPITRPVVPTQSRGIYTVDYALRPGESRVQVAYRLPYGSLTADFDEKPLYRMQEFRVFAPTAMQFSGTNFTSVGDQEGYRAYSAKSLAAPLAFSVSGNAPMPQIAQPNAAAGPSAGGASDNSMSPPAAERQSAAPAKTFMERNLWTVLAFLCLGVAAGLGYLMSRPTPAEAAPPNPPGASSAARKPLAKQPRQAPSFDVNGATAEPATSDNLQAELAKLKDQFFLLEVRHSTGDIGEEEYARSRKVLEQRIKELARTRV